MILVCDIIYGCYKQSHYGLQAQGLSSHFDEHLSYVLTPALWSYEREAVDGGSLTENRGAELFSAALMNVVSEGYTFKGFPLYFTHNSPRRAFTSILR